MMNEDIEFVKPKERRYNRRSSFFQRSTVSLFTDSPTSSSARSDSPTESNVTRPAENEKTEYLKELEKEKREWKELLLQKKKQLKDLKEKSAQVAPSVDFLTPEDRKFLEDRPNYLAIGRLLDNVTELVLIKERRINATVEKVNNLIYSCENTCNDKADSVIDYFLDDFGEFKEDAPAS